MLFESSGTGSTTVAKLIFFGWGIDFFRFRIFDSPVLPKFQILLVRVLIAALLIYHRSHARLASRSLAGEDDKEAKAGDEHKLEPGVVVHDDGDHSYRR